MTGVRILQVVAIDQVNGIQGDPTSTKSSYFREDGMARKDLHDGVLLLDPADCCQEGMVLPGQLHPILQALHQPSLGVRSSPYLGPTKSLLLNLCLIAPKCPHIAATS